MLGPVRAAISKLRLLFTGCMPPQRHAKADVEWLGERE